MDYPLSTKKSPDFTLDGFVHSLTDKPWYFPFFLDKAMSIAVNKGIRCEDEKKEFAIVAIEHLWKNIEKFDPSRAEFSSFFNTCIGNKIADQVNASRSDIVFGQNRTDLDNIDNYGESVSDEEDQRGSKRLEFADELISVFEKFIDTLPPDKRQIFCASEFGRLSMGETPSGRNYADLIAAQTNRTAAAVRKIVERLKKEAIGYVQERGFDYGAYSTHIEFLTTKPKKDKVDFSAIDWTALSGVQRLKLRMYLYKKAVEDGIIDEE